MREILFRGKRLDNGKWIASGNIIRFNPECGEDPVFIPGLNEKCTCAHDEFDNIIAFEKVAFYKVDPKTVCQFTGLYNAANQKIWEGDIVRFGNANYVVQREDETPGGYWASTAYIMKEIGVCDYMSFVDTIDDYYNEICVEIIGNIHDNPELLEGGVDNG